MAPRVSASQFCDRRPTLCTLTPRTSLHDALIADALYWRCRRASPSRLAKTPTPSTQTSSRQQERNISASNVTWSDIYQTTLSFSLVVGILLAAHGTSENLLDTAKDLLVLPHRSIDYVILAQVVDVNAINVSTRMRCRRRGDLESSFQAR